MQLKSTIPILTILFNLLFVPFGTNANVFQENPLTKAIQLFDKEKFAEAEPLFKKLLDERTDDFMVNYFYGACRTENGHYGKTELNYLVKASKEVNPLNIDYYLAVQNHALNQWDKALAYYKLYKTTASTNDQEKMQLTQKMEQCANRINPFVTNFVDESLDNADETIAGFTGAAVVAAESTNEVAFVPSVVKLDSTNSEQEDDDEQVFLTEDDSTNVTHESELDSIQVEELEEVEEAQIVEVLPVEERIQFNVNNEITYISVSNFRTDDGEKLYDEAVVKEAELKKIVNETENLREKYKTSQSRTEKDVIGQQIVALEGQAYDLKNEATQLFYQAKNVENDYWLNASPEETENFIKELNATVLQSNKVINNTNDSFAEKPALIIPPILMDEEKLENTPIKETPSGISYRIQIGAYSRGIPNTEKQAFNKISILRKVDNYTDENGVVVYTTGNLTNYEDAVQMQKQVKQEGIKDPKIAAYLNGKRITLEQAKEIDKIQ